MIKITDNEKVYIVLGAGGTGGWLIPGLSKMDLDLILIDGDIVEEKNIKRQNFFKEDISHYKAEAISERYDIPYINEFVSSTDLLKEIIEEYNKVPVIIGCLDNNASRHLIHELFNELDDIIWVDSGNAERHGQTYVAVKENGEIKYPSPISIDIAFANTMGDERRPDQISCAEHSESAPQNIAANIMASSVLLSLIGIINSNGALLGNKYKWDTRTVTMVSEETL